MRRWLPRAGMLAAIAAIAWLWLGGGLEVLGLSGGGAGEDSGGGPAPAEARADLETAAEQAAQGLQRFPGLRLERRGSGSVTGVVALLVPGAGTKPLPGAAVEALAREDGKEARASAETDAEGRFALAPLPSGPGYVVAVRHPPHRDLLVRGVVVHEGLATDLGTLVFGAPTSLEGTVVDAAGRPVGDARVGVERDRTAAGGIDLLRALRELAEAPGPLAEGRSLADGTFSVGGLPPGRYSLRVRRPGYASALVTGAYVTADGDASRVRVILDAGAGFEGRVTGEGGAALGGAAVVALAVKAEKADAMDRHEVRTDADGRYRLDTLVSGTMYFLEAHAPGHAPSGRFLAALGVSRQDFDLVLGGRIEGRVTDGKTGSPVARPEVLAITGLVGRGAAPVSVVGGDDGRYAIENVTPGPLVLLEVRAPGYGPYGSGFDPKAPREVRAGETLFADVAMASGGSVAGVVRDEGGRPLPYVSVAATRPRDRYGGETATLTEADGSYRLLGLRFGRHTLVVTAPGYAPPVEDAEVEVDVSEERPEAVRDFVLRPGAVVSGRVTRSDGSPAAGVRAAVVAPGRREAGRVRDLVAVVDSSGGYRVGGAPPGIDLVLEAVAESGVRTASPPFRVRSGEARTVDLVLRPGARVVGTVVDSTGRGVREARVRFGHVEPEDAGRVSDSFRAEDFLVARTFRSDDAGRFSCEDVPPGRTLLKVEADGYAPWFRRDLEVPEKGDLVGITVTLVGERSVSGRVVAADTGRPLPGVWLYARTRDAEGAPADEGNVRTIASAESGPDGRYSLDRLPPGPVEVVVWLALGYKNGWEDRASARRESVPSGSSGVDFRLLPQAPPEAAPPK